MHDFSDVLHGRQSHAKLGGLDLSLAILSGADLTSADLTCTKLDGAKLDGAMLDRPHLVLAQRLLAEVGEK